MDPLVQVRAREGAEPFTPWGQGYSPKVGASLPAAERVQTKEQEADPV